MGSNSKLVIGLSAAIIVLLLVVVALLAYTAGQRSAPTDPVATVPQPPALQPEPPPSEAPPAEDAPSVPESSPDESTASAGGRPSLDPFPETMEELQANPRALDAAEAIVTGSERSLSLDNYGKHGEGCWAAEFQAESGNYVLLGCSDGWDPQEGFVVGYVTLLRETPAGFEYITAGQDIPEVVTLRRAGITPDEYREHLLPLYGEWPSNDSGEVRSW